MNLSATAPTPTTMSNAAHSVLGSYQTKVTWPRNPDPRAAAPAGSRIETHVLDTAKIDHSLEPVRFEGSFREALEGARFLARKGSLPGWLPKWMNPLPGFSSTVAVADAGDGAYLLQFLPATVFGTIAKHVRRDQAVNGQDETHQTLRAQRSADSPLRALVSAKSWIDLRTDLEAEPKALRTIPFTDRVIVN